MTSKSLATLRILPLGVFVVAVFVFVLQNSFYGQDNHSNRTIPETELEKPKFEPGVLSSSATEMKNLIRLGWDKNRLRLERDWADPNAGKSEEEIRKARIQRYMDRGLPEEQAAELIDRRVVFGDSDDDPLTVAFRAFGARFGEGSSGAAGGGHRRRLSFHNEHLSGTAAIVDELLRFEFTENEPPFQRLTVQDQNDGRLSILFSTDDLLIELRQSTNKKTRLTYVVNERAYLMMADNFDEFSKKYSRATVEILFPLFRHVGIDLPIQADSPEVKAYVRQHFVAMNSRKPVSIENFQRLLLELDSSKFDKRLAATDALTAQYDVWSDLLRSSAIDSSLSLEVRNRIQMIINENEAVRKDARELREFVEERKLIDSVEYLLNLLPDSDENSLDAIYARLQKITGKTRPEIDELWKNRPVDSGNGSPPADKPPTPTPTRESRLH